MHKNYANPAASKLGSVIVRQQTSELP